MNHQLSNHNLIAGVVGGTFFSSVMNIGVEDIITTSILAIVGAVVSFFVSVFLKYLFEKLKKRLNR